MRIKISKENINPKLSIIQALVNGVTIIRNLKINPYRPP